MKKIIFIFCSILLISFLNVSCAVAELKEEQKLAIKKLNELRKEIHEWEKLIISEKTRDADIALNQILKKHGEWKDEWDKDKYGFAERLIGKKTLYEIGNINNWSCEVNKFDQSHPDNVYGYKTKICNLTDSIEIHFSHFNIRDEGENIKRVREKNDQIQVGDKLEISCQPVMITLPHSKKYLQIACNTNTTKYRVINY